MGATVFERLLAEEIGLEPASLGTSAVADAVRRRMGDRQIADEAAYRACVQAEADELQNLAESVVVAETWFFRDRESFELLAQYVRKEWPTTHAAERLRVLSMPCSTGEEPYSIAITLREAGFGADRYQIDAADLSRPLIGRAETGTYGPNSFRGAPWDRARRYFTAVKGGFSVNPELRESLLFTWGNLLKEDGFPREAGYHVVFCRNLLIYQHEAARRRIIARLDRCLAPGGLLFVGHAERLVLFPHHLQTIQHPGAFAYRKTAPQPEPVPLATRGPRADGRQGNVPGPAHHPAQPPTEGAATVDAGADHHRVQTTTVRAAIVRAHSLADQGRLDEAAVLCEAALHQQTHEGAVYRLLGIIRARQGQTDTAENLLNRALYLDTEDYDALIHLALLKASRGDASAAERLRQRAARVHQRQSTAA